MKTTRRQFLSAAIGSSAVVALGARPPQFLLDAAAAEPTSCSETVLVVLQLTGGNDGLNTIVPYADDAYRRQRPTLALAESQVLKISDYCGFHPSLSGLANLLDAGRLAIVQGVGYEDPNRSHFESMDIWHTCCRDKQRRRDGWLGRYLDATGRSAGGDVPALHLGSDKQPLALAAQKVRVPSFRSVERFRLHMESKELRAAVEQLAGIERGVDGDLLQFIQSSTTAALAASQRVESVMQQSPATGTTYPASELGEKLRIIAHLIDAGMSTRIYYVELDGFDTHSQQADAHAALLKQMSTAVASFASDLSERGHIDRVLLMTFSEFGRRVEENASRGTDHGAAAPMFLAGGRVNAGLVGPHPSLADLADGDLKHHTDFRQVYGTVLEDWLGSRSEPIVGGKFERLALFKG